MAVFSYECETVTATTNGTVSTGSSAGASNGQYRQLAGTPADGQYIEYTTPALPAGIYSLVFYYRNGTTRAKNTFKWDGSTVGGTLDQYATPGFVDKVPYTVGDVTVLTGGSTHTFRVTNTGRNAASTGWTQTGDYFTLTATQIKPKWIIAVES